MEDVDLQDRFVYFPAIQNILWPFGMARVKKVYFAHFGIFGPIKIWHTWWRTILANFLDVTFAQTETD